MQSSADPNRDPDLDLLNPKSVGCDTMSRTPTMLSFRSTHPYTHPHTHIHTYIMI